MFATTCSDFGFDSTVDRSFVGVAAEDMTRRG
jgi:hypothetical protein